MLPPDQADFYKLIQGKPVRLIVLKNVRNTTVCITNYGARIVKFIVIGKHGAFKNIVAGFDSIDEYLNSSEVYHGAIVGRYANRIANGRFKINDHVFSLNVNNSPNHLHGGRKGFHDVVWDIKTQDQTSVEFSYLSANNEEGYPGNLSITVTYKLTEGDALEISFTASTDRDTVLNVTNHAYFNLNGIGTGSILDHNLQINADHFTPVDKFSIPFGTINHVAGTPFDFRTAKSIGKNINDKHEQLSDSGGYDHNYMLNKNYEGELALAAFASGDKSGIALEVFTTEPGMQFYTAKSALGYSSIDESSTSFNTFCLETQHFPDSPNQPSFPSTILRAGDIFVSKTVFKSSVIK